MEGKGGEGNQEICPGLKAMCVKSHKFQQFAKLGYKLRPAIIIKNTWICFWNLPPALGTELPVCPLDGTVFQEDEMYLWRQGVRRA